MSPDDDTIEQVIEARARDLGGISVRRTLPVANRRSVGPFVFVDHIGPTTFAPGDGIDVRPHPHIALATITYLFEGTFVHRDSLGSNQPIRPGDVNWMIAGKGVAHSERTAPEVRAAGGALHGVQTWVALPHADEDMAPRFEHHPKATMPVVTRPGATIALIAGTAYGARAPTGVRSPTLYAHARLDDGATLAVDDGHAERAVYVVRGEVSVSGHGVGVGAMVVLRPGADVRLDAITDAEVMLLGGAPLDGPRLIWWNFVSSSQARLDQAKADWKARRFPPIPGDDDEYIPLPDGP